MNFILDKENLLKEIAAGEDAHLEFKEVVFKGQEIRFGRDSEKATKLIAEVLVSFANTDGGVVLFGVNKEGHVIGIDEIKKDLLEQFIVNICRDQCKPSLEPIIRRMLTARRFRMPFEECPALGSQFVDINLEKFYSYYERRFYQKRTDIEIPIEKLLTNLKLMHQDEENERLNIPTNLGILLFCDHPEKILNGAYVDLALYNQSIADGNTIDTKKISGTIVEQIESIVKYIQLSPFNPTRSTKDETGRLDEPTYSLRAIQEAVVNAIVHRDYELTGSQIRIFMFPDRIEFWSPGELHNTFTPENLYAGCQPMRRNQHLAGFLRDFVSPITQRSYMEARGEGFLTLVRESEKLSGKKPLLRVVGQAVCLTIFAKS